jgi:hypothetical protein
VAASDGIAIAGRLHQWDHDGVPLVVRDGVVLHRNALRPRDAGTRAAR